MSYDLFFYKHKSNKLTTEQVGDYLSNNLVPVNETGNQWVFENEDTGVYYAFEKTEENEEDEFAFKDYQDINLSFNLNFIRPCFFGLEAFMFIEKFINDLDLFIDNPQDGKDEPYKPTKEELFEIWNRTNIWASKDYVNEGSVYYPVDRSNSYWAHNYHRKAIQNEIGDGYFVSKILLFKRLKDNAVVTVSVWSEHIPNILPVTDYYLLNRKYKKFLRKVKDTVLLTQNDFNNIFGDHFQSYHFTNTIIIHPKEAASIEKRFNSVKSELDYKRDLIYVHPESIINVLKE